MQLNDFVTWINAYCATHHRADVIPRSTSGPGG